MVRGMKAYDLGKGIAVPVAGNSLERKDVLGKPVDRLAPSSAITHTRFIVRPSLRISTTLEMLRRAFRSSPHEPYLKGRKIGLSAARVRQDRLIMERIHNVAMKHGGGLRDSRGRRAHREG